jgi:hypothetical protein
LTIILRQHAIARTFIPWPSFPNSFRTVQDYKYGNPPLAIPMNPRLQLEDPLDVANAKPTSNSNGNGTSIEDKNNN